MKNCYELSAMFAPQLPQDRQQAKRNAALLESVVHVMEQDVVVIWELLQRNNLKAARICGWTECREHGFRREFRAQFLGDGERVIADPVDSARNFGNDLKERAQTETVCAVLAPLVDL
jgi:hypothetical protein